MWKRANPKQPLFPLEMQLVVDGHKKNVVCVTYFLEVEIVSAISRYLQAS